jgi:preprotein translocase subunit SecE
MSENAQEQKKDKKGFLKNAGRFLRDTRGEMRKVVWPSRKQAVNNTLVVLIFMAIMAVVIGVFDYGVNSLILLMRGGSGAGATGAGTFAGGLISLLLGRGGM